MSELAPLPPSVLAEVFAHAAEAVPEEACGLIVETGPGIVAAIRAANLSADPRTSFIVHPRTFADASRAGRIVAIYHSHPNGTADPSPADRILRDDPRRLCVPFLIVSPHLGTHTYTAPEMRRAPLEGRPWVPGVLDCYGVVRDYYAERHEIELPDPFRGDWDYERSWKESRRSPFLDYAGQARLVRVPRETIRASDILLFRWLFDVEHHVAVYLGGSQILHHPIGALSRREPYGETWRGRLASAWRHETLLMLEDAREA